MLQPVLQFWGSTTTSLKKIRDLFNLLPLFGWLDIFNSDLTAFGSDISGLVAVTFLYERTQSTL